MATHPAPEPEPRADRHDLSDLLTAIETSRSTSTPEEHATFLRNDFRLGVHGGSVPRAGYLLANYPQLCSTRELRHETVAGNASVELLEVLVKYGYGPDKPGLQNTNERGRRLIDYSRVLSNDEVVRWLVQRGVSLTHGQAEYAVVPMPPPLGETAAQYASVAMLRLLVDKGAKRGRRMLHSAVLYASAIKADPAVPASRREWPGFQPGKKFGVDRQRMSEVLPYLVEELGLDVNALDIEGREEREVPTGHYGTPLCYAVYHNSAAVVRWLLEKGARPREGDAVERADAVRLAKALGSGKCLEVFEGWAKEKEKGKGAVGSG